MRIPTEQDATHIVEEITGEKVQTIKRFSTGKAHYVYDVTTDKRPIVARIAREDSIYFFKGAVYWYPKLQERTVPLPNLIYSELNPTKHGFAVMIMDRVPGKDLGDIYETLSKEEKKELADQIVSFQLKVHGMPLGPGFGYAHSYDDQKLHKNYIDVIYAHLERSKSRIKDEEIVGYDLIEQVRRIIEKYRSYFTAVEPMGFLDDTTTKNVLIDNGRLTGVVDVDFVCFGDIVQLLGLINMALLEKKCDTDYVDYLSERLSLTEEQKTILNVNTLLYAIDFLTFHGHSFNKGESINIEKDEINHLKSIVTKYIALV